MSNNQGTVANMNGKIFENTLIPMLTQHGYTVVKYKDYKNKQVEYDALDKLVVLQFPFTSIYNHQGKTEFLIINKPLKRRIRVECKWQQTAGSVDEKLPYLYLNSVYAFEEKEIILLVDGGGFKQGAVDWLRNASKSRWLLDSDLEKCIKVMELRDFMIFANKEL